MADPTGIVNDCVGRHVQYVESTLGRQLGYLIHHNRNLQNLQTQLGKLNVATVTMREKVGAAEAKGEKIHANVQEWLDNVAEIIKEAEEIVKGKRQSTTGEANKPLKDEGQSTESSKDERQPKMKCVQGFCPNPMLRRRRSKKSLALVEEVIKLINDEMQLSNISYAPPKDLQTEVDKLSVAKVTVDEKVNAALDKGEKIHANVQNWLKNVAEITKEAEEFLKDEIQATEEPNDSLSHPSKKSLELLQVVTELYEMREFSDISYVGRAEDACLASPDEDYEKFDSRVSTLEKIMKELASSSTDMILVYGIGGVGKTTLAEEVLRQAQKQRLFDDAVMVRDVKIPNLEAIQNQIADKLGLNILNIQTVPGRADKINERIKDKKSLVILDDVWGEIDLKAVGLPHIPTCRILLTSRSQQVFSNNIKQKEFPLGVLDEKEAWNLFKKKAGDVVADPAIQIVATQVAQKCGGLPVLIITVARALEKKTLPIWKNALKSLGKFDERGNLTQKAYSGIEWSYRQLSHQELLQPLFLLCGTTVQGNYISLTNLLRYSIGLGFFEDHTVEEARNALYDQVDKLKSSCLLLEGYDNTCVRMHDLVHDVAKRIARRDQHVLVEDEDVEDGGPELKKWPNEAFFNECTKISLLCCNIATLPEVPWECPKLEMFHLHRVVNKIASRDQPSSRDIPSKFFEEMKELKVLDLNNLPPVSLPPSLKCLENLQTLCLDGCMSEDIALVGELRNLQILSIVKSKVKQLPKEIGKLTGLRLLDLSDCYRLEVISPGVISNLTSLEELRMRNSFDKWEGEGVICETSNARLLELKNLSKLTALEIRIPDANILPPNLFSDELEKYQILVGDAWKRDDKDETTLNTLKLELTTSNELDQGLKMLLKRCEVLSLDGKKGFDFAYVFTTKEVMFNLTTLSVYKCDGLKCLLSSSMAQNLKKLKHLEISDCKIMEQIISRREHDEEDYMFGDLKSLKLKSLPNLASMMGILNPLQASLHISSCDSLEVVFDEHGLTNVKETHGTSTTQLKDSQNEISVHIEGCRSLKSIFPPSMMGRFSSYPLQVSLHISSCDSLEAVFDERGLTNVKETHGTSTTQLKDGQNEISVYIEGCRSLKSIFPPSMMERFSSYPLEASLHISSCDSLEAVFDERGLTNVETHGTSTTQLKDVQNEISVHIEGCRSLKNIFPSMMGRFSSYPLEASLHISSCDSLETIFDERGLTNVKETHGTSTTQLKDGQNEISVHIEGCHSLKSIFPPSMMGRLNPLQASLPPCTHATRSKDGQNEISVHIEGCRSFKSIFPPSMM